MIGPVYEKFVEAVALVRAGYVFPVENEGSALRQLALLSDDHQRDQIKNGLAQFMQQQVGATDKIMDLIAGNKWL
jgi:3-deoxy-D-manno-octulosonic-acid transferase